MLKIVLGIIFFYMIVQAAVDPDCFEWFQKSGVKTDSTGCVLSCSALPIGMSTFYCPNQCDQLCKPIACENDLFWKNYLKSGQPSEWKAINEKSTNWSEEEKNIFLGVLGRLPDEMKKIPFDGFYRMQKSNTVTNPASTSESGKVVIIYDRTFKNPFWTAEEIILHELGHVIFLNLSKKEQRSYKNKLGWKKLSGRDISRDDGFVSPRAKDSPHEDFAENFSFFLKDSSLLKLKAPMAYDWLIKKYKINFKLKKGCPHEKK